MTLDLPLPRPKRRPKRLRAKRREMTVEQVLDWADAFHERTGKWPMRFSGLIPETLSETWMAVNQALYDGLRGLPTYRVTLAQFLAEHRGVRNRRCRPLLTEAMILSWADDHFQRTGDWPHHDSGVVAAAPQDTWQHVEGALHFGRRGLPAGGSLRQLLAKHRNVRNHMRMPPLAVDQILKWADAFHQRTGQWPQEKSGPFAEMPSETWGRIHRALFSGGRGLPGGSSLPQLLSEHREVRNIQRQPPLTEAMILNWADDHVQRTGKWPGQKSGQVLIAPQESWQNIDNALYRGRRGLTSGRSLRDLLAKHRGVRHRHKLPHLQIRQILRWADAFHRRTGRWPAVRSGPIPDTNGETWSAFESALVEGLRGLPGGSSLRRLLDEHGRLRNP